VGVNLAAKGTFLEDIGALFTGTKTHLIKFWRYMLEHRRHMFEFWCQVFDFGAEFLNFGQIHKKTHF